MGWLRWGVVHNNGKRRKARGKEENNTQIRIRVTLRVSSEGKRTSARRGVQSKGLLPHYGGSGGPGGKESSQGDRNSTSPPGEGDNTEDNSSDD